ncbi:hypothetical protein D1BOALGB6SA_10506 [Olavius sp. associated proteobacterium Delta 1]|nr:hypothetical protein D1BOALGB6SA_10506 [Olavius sp. associated proteobacterium Delta 1]
MKIEALWNSIELYFNQFLSDWQGEEQGRLPRRAYSKMCE